MGDRVFLKLSPRKGFQRIGKRGKFNPRYIGPYEIIERVGEVAYRLDLPPNLTGIHNVFHVSQLRKYHPDESHIIATEELPLEQNLTYTESPVRILDYKVKELRNKRIPMVKVLWRNQKSEEATWELEDKSRVIFRADVESGDQIPLREEDCDAPKIFKESD